MFFEINADLSIHSKRPTHLQKRLQSRPKSSADMHHEAAALKRESIIQQRRQRNAERWQKIISAVEECKQMRASNSSLIERSIAEGLESAQRKRDMLLQKKEEKFAGRVEYAKRIAQMADEKRKMKANLSRKKMEKRLSESMVRRQVLAKVPRCKLLDEEFIEAELMKYKQAAKAIQRWWRLRVLMGSLLAFKRTGLFGDEVVSVPFERLAPMLQDKRVIAVTSKLLLQLKKITARGRSRRYKNPTRVFLSAFLIVHHTSEIMSDFGEQEKIVKELGAEMLKLFNALMEEGSMEKVEEFVEAWHQYHMAFEQWKSADTEKVLNYMFEHFMQLERLRQSVQSEPGANAEWNPQIEKQQQMIREKVVRIGGKSALNRFLNGQKQFRDISDSSDAEVMSDSSPMKKRPDSVTNSRYSPVDETLAPEPQPQENLQQVLQEFGGMMTNEKLAHELIMNPDFELQINANSLEAQIKAVAKRAFFDKIRQDLAQNNYSWVPGIIADIKGQLLEMLPEKARVRTEIQEVLDEEYIHQQVERTGRLDNIDGLIKFVTEKMLQLCAPIRDSSIRQIEQMPDLVQRVESILSIIDDMKLDLANFRLRSLRPHLMKQAVEYEQSKFSQALQAGQVSLEYTRKWLSGAVKALEEKAAARNPENVEHPQNRVRYDEIYFDALLSLLFNPEAYQPEELAETLRMDSERIANIQNEIRAISVVASLLMLTRNLVSAVRDDPKLQVKLKNELLLLLQEPHTTAEHLSLHISQQFKLSGQQESMLKSMVEKTLTFKDTVFSLLNRRIMTSIRSHLLSGRVRRDSNTGLEVVQNEVDSLSTRLFILAQHNRQVFAKWYDEIISHTQQQ